MKIKNDSKFHNQNILIVKKKNFNLYPSKYFFFIRMKYTHLNDILPLIIWNTSSKFTKSFKNTHLYKTNSFHITVQLL